VQLHRSVPYIDFPIYVVITIVCWYKIWVCTWHVNCWINLLLCESVL